MYLSHTQTHAHTHTQRHFIHLSIIGSVAIGPFSLINFPIIWLTAVWIYTACVYVCERARVHSQGYDSVPAKPIWDLLS